MPVKSFAAIFRTSSQTAKWFVDNGEQFIQGIISVGLTAAAASLLEGNEVPVVVLDTGGQFTVFIGHPFAVFVGVEGIGLGIGLGIGQMLCQGTACHVNGSEKIEKAIKDELGISDGETTEDGLFTLKNVACLGCCSLSPVMMINDETYGSLTPDKTKGILRNLRAKED